MIDHPTRRPALARLRLGTVLLVAAVVPCIALNSSASAVDTLNAGAQAASGGTANRSTDEMIRGLIEKLGSDSYATRIRAREQLQAYGLEAFDALREVQDHDDVEIQTAARYLIKSLHVSWSKESDPKEVREILAEYGAQDETERLGRIEMLGRLPDEQGGEALARLARFELSEPLSRRAAVLVLGQPLPREKVSRLRLAEQMERVIGENQRDASRWLLAYSQDLREGQYSAERWSNLIERLRTRVDAGIDSNVSSASVMQLIRVLAGRALAEGAEEAALDLVMSHNDLVAPTTRDLAEHAAWAIHEHLYPVVLKLFEMHQLAFRENAELLYSAAQAFDERGDNERANRLASEALTINPLPKLPGQSDRDDDQDTPEAANPPNAMTDHQLQETANSHLEIAMLLKSRGRFDWSERECELVIANCDIESGVGARTRQVLAMTYSEQLRHKEAADVIEEMVDRAKKDRLYQPRMARLEISISFLRSLYEYESGLALLDQHLPNPKDEVLAEVKQRLQLAYRFDTDNIDILIRMYRLEDPSDPDWKPTVMKQIIQNREKLSRDIAVIEARKNVISEARYEAELGELYNQFAWLVANTEGDFERALKLSQQSLDYLDADQVSHRAARLDTCARCYYALGRVAEAVETQREAIDLEPHSPAMLRQLDEFQKAL